MKFVCIVGARPQFIKLAPLCRSIANWNAVAPDRIDSVILHTGQHYDSEMSRVFFDQMQIPEPTYNLEVGSGSHAVQTGLMMEKIEAVLQKEAPDIVVVFGDTNSTLAGALTASKLNIPVAHVEAGLRSYNRQMPEEINRVITDRVSTILFCPTDRAISNLKREGLSTTVSELSPRERYPELLKQVSSADPLLVKSGDIMYDAFLFNMSVAEKMSTILKELGLQGKKYSLLTIHRAESTKDIASLERIMSFLQSEVKESELVFPVHPRTKNFILNKRITLPAHVRMIPPVSYHDMILLEKNASTIFTDSGGVQKEAYFARIPCVTLRTETEWPETVESGWNRLMNDMRVQQQNGISGDGGEQFGDGNSAEIHLKVLVDFCKATIESR